MPSRCATLGRMALVESCSGLNQNLLGTYLRHVGRDPQGTRQNGGANGEARCAPLQVPVVRERCMAHLGAVRVGAAGGGRSRHPVHQGK